MTAPKLSIDTKAAPQADSPPSRGKRPAAPSPSRRPRLPTGISYHPTPAGLKYRIRIRSAKKLEALGTDKAIDEIFDSLQLAEQRLISLKYKKDDVKVEFYQKSLEQINSIKIETLLETHYEKYYSKLTSAKEHKSRMNVISRTLIPVEDKRLIMFLNTKFSMNEFNKDEIPFGMVPVVEYNKYIHAYIDKRRERVKNQTIVNDLMFLINALKNANNYFKNIPKIANPLENIDFKTLKDQVTYRDKRLSPTTRARIEGILIEKSRKEHYRDMFVFLYETGVRISEALTILRKDIDLDKGIIFLVSKKSENKIRYLGINQKLREVLEERVKGLKLTDRIFPNSKETYQTKLKGIRPILDELGIKFHWHMLRHTFISNGMETKPLSTLMSEVDINNFQHFQQKYLNPKISEDIAIKVSKAKQLTPDELRIAVGHNDLQMTIGTYTHERQLSNEELLMKQNEELKAMLLAMTQQLIDKKTT